MAALGDCIASPLLDFDLGSQDVESSLDEFALAHHSLVEYVQFRGVRLKDRFPCLGQKRMQVVPGCPCFDNYPRLGLAWIVHA